MDKDPIWAEAVTRWAEGEPLYLSKELEELAVEAQEGHREMSPREGIILDFLEQKVPEDWGTWDLNRRRVFWQGNHTEEVSLVDRDRVCALEVWCEALDQDARSIKNSDAAEINRTIAMLAGWKRMDKAGRFGLYKVQRGFQKRSENA